MSDHEQQAQDFLEATGVKIEFVKLGTFPYFDDDKESRDVFQVTIVRDDRRYSFRYGDSIKNTLDRLLGAYSTRPVPTQELFKHTRTRNAYEFAEYCKKNYKKLRATPKQPTAYAVLACLTKYEPGSFANFCSEYGYDTDSRGAEKTYLAVMEEWGGVCRIWSATEREQLAEIS